MRRFPIRAATEKIGVVARATVTVAAVDHRVVARAAEQGIVSAKTFEKIVAVAAVKIVVPVQYDRQGIEISEQENNGVRSSLMALLRGANSYS